MSIEAQCAVEGSSLDIRGYVVFFFFAAEVSCLLGTTESRDNAQ
jgi:hypothetical protein